MCSAARTRFIIAVETTSKNEMKNINPDNLTYCIIDDDVMDSYSAEDLWENFRTSCREKSGWNTGHYKRLGM